MRDDQATEKEKKEFAKRLKGVMDEKGITVQAELAEKLGTSGANVNRWLKGESMPTYDNILLLCRELEVPPERLIGERVSKVKHRACIIWDGENHSESIKTALYVLGSGTHLADSLEMNIKSFGRSLKSDADIQSMHKEIQEMRREITDLKDQLNFYSTGESENAFDTPKPKKDS